MGEVDAGVRPRRYAERGEQWSRREESKASLAATENRQGKPCSYMTSDPLDRDFRGKVFDISSYVAIISPLFGGPARGAPAM